MPIRPASAKNDADTSKLLAALLLLAMMQIPPSDGTRGYESLLLQWEQMRILVESYLDP